MYPVLAERHELLQNERRIGACGFPLHRVFWHLGGPFQVLQELNRGNASPGVAWLQGGGNWGQEKPVSQQSLLPVGIVVCSCGQKHGDQKVFAYLPHFIWGIAGGHPAAIASTVLLAGVSLASWSQWLEGELIV